MLLTLPFLLACPGPPDTGDSEPPQASWEHAFDASTTGSLSGVWGSGPDDVFIVGGDDEAGEAWHFDGSAWSEMTLPAELPLLVWVHGFGPNEVYAVGVDGAAAKWDGQQWSSLSTGTDEDLWGIWGASADDMWIVGGDPNVGEPLILHFDGQSFTPVPLEEGENDRGATTLFKVWGTEDTAFIVGQHGLILQLQDGVWRRVGGGAQANVDLIALWGSSADHIVAVGGRANARVAEWDGSAWETVAPSGVGGLSAVHVEPGGRAVVGGVVGYLGTWEDGELTREGEFLTTVDIHAMWGDDAGRTWAVGGNFRAPHRGVALVRSEP